MAKAQEKYQFLPESWLNRFQKAHFDAVAELAEAIVLLTSGQPHSTRTATQRPHVLVDRHPGISLLLLGFHPAILGNPMVVDGDLRNTLQFGDYSHQLLGPLG